MKRATSTIALLAAWIWAFQGCDLKRENTRTGTTQLTAPGRHTTPSSSQKAKPGEAGAIAALHAK